MALTTHHAATSLTHCHAGASFQVLRARVVKTFHKHLQSTMKRARKAMLEQARIERQRESAAMLRRRNVSSTAESEGEWGVQYGTVQLAMWRCAMTSRSAHRPTAARGHWPDKEKEKEFEVTDIFVLLNRNGDSTLTKEEFDSIFTTLQIKVSPRKVGQSCVQCALPPKPLLL